MPRYEYTCGDMRAITSETVRGASHAARVFAHRRIAKEYGRRSKLIDLEEEIRTIPPSKVRRYKFIAKVGVDGASRARRLKIEVFEHELPEFTRFTALKSAMQLAKKTRRDWIVYCINNSWDRVSLTSFTYDSNTEGLSAALRVTRAGTVEPLYQS